MSQLVDQFGRSIDPKALKQELAAPSLTSVRQVISDHPAQGLTPARLANLLREAEFGYPERYLALAEEMEEKDLHYLSVLNTRKRALVALEINVEAASDDKADQDAAELVRAVLADDRLEDQLYDLMDAIGKGFSITEILWDTSGKQWRPMDLKWRDPRWFVFDPNDGRTPLLRDGSGFLPLAPYKFITHMPAAKSGLPLRGGLARAAGWSYLFKNYTIKDWVTFAEIYGQPLRVGKYGPNASEAEIDILLRAVREIGSDAAAVIPESMLIDFKDAGGKSASAELYERLVSYLDNQVSKAVLGQTLTSDSGHKGGGGGGSLAMARVHDEVRHDILRSDARQVSATLNRDLVRPLVDLNLGPRPRYPRVVLQVQEADDLAALADALSKLVPVGIQAPAGWARDKFGIPDPQDGEPVLGAMPGATPAPAAAAANARETGRICPSCGVAHGQDGHLPNDALDDLRELALDGWQPVMKPITHPIAALAANAQSLEQLRDQLAGVLADMDVTALAELLARAAFQARLAGEAGADIVQD